MRDGIPVIALVASCIAFLVAVVGVVAPDGTEDAPAPAEKLKAAIDKLDRVEAGRKAMSEQIAKLGDDIVKIKEASAGVRGEAFNKTEIENVVRRVVNDELSKRITTEAAALGAKVEGKTVAAPARATAAAPPKAAPAPKPVSGQERRFNQMLDALSKDIGLDDARSGTLKLTLAGLRSELNTIFKDARNKKMDDAARDTLAAAARTRADDRIAKILTAEQMKKYESWRVKGDDYTKKFFGLIAAK
jgi:hypothetical protein